MGYDPLARMLVTTGLTEQMIADALRSGQPSESFCNLLATMLAPPANKRPAYRLVLVKRKGRPKKDDTKYRNPDLGRMMAEAVDDNEEFVEVAVALAKEKFKVGRSTALKALEFERLWRLVERKSAKVAI